MFMSAAKKEEKLLKCQLNDKSVLFSGWELRSSGSEENSGITWQAIWSIGED